MTRARVMLHACIAKRKLKSICEDYDISYKFAHGVAKGTKIPSYDLIKKFKPMIAPEFWFQEASGEDIKAIKDAVSDD